MQPNPHSIVTANPALPIQKNVFTIGNLLRPVTWHYFYIVQIATICTTDTAGIIAAVMLWKFPWVHLLCLSLLVKEAWTLKIQAAMTVYITV